MSDQQPQGHAAPTDSQPREGGRGESSLFEEPHRIREDLRLTELAIRKGWITPAEVRWDTECTVDEIERQAEQAGGNLTLAQKALLSSHKAMSLGLAERASENDIRAMMRGAALTVTMTGQNQADEHKRLPDLVAHYHQMSDDEKRQRLREMVDAAKGSA